MRVKVSRIESTEAGEGGSSFAQLKHEEFWRGNHGGVSMAVYSKSKDPSLEGHCIPNENIECMGQGLVWVELEISVWDFCEGGEVRSEQWWIENAHRDDLDGLSVWEKVDWGWLKVDWRRGLEYGNINGPSPWKEVLMDLYLLVI